MEDDIPKPKILIIRFSSIGDIVLITPVIRTIKKQVKNAEIHVLTKERNAIILLNNTYVDKIHTFKTHTGEVIEELRAEKFSHIIDLQKNLRSIFLSLSLRKNYSTFTKLNIRKWLLTRFKINIMPDVHIVDRYFKAVKKLNVKNDGLGSDYFLCEDDFASIDSLPSNFTNNYVAVVCGSLHATKQIPEDMLVKICKEINSSIVLLGDKADRGKAIEVENAVGTKIFNACGVFNLNQTAAIVSKASLIITADTGLMHIAAALQKNIIVIWGNTVPAFGMSAYKPDNATFSIYNFEVTNLKCRPCSKLGYKCCPQKHFKCMKNQNIHEIVKIANEIITK
ncbi:MAG: glycosyltransferase family 9 protein [Bacteroidales bacterium]|jgi:ADP-heptose:LPS heptosyltransferase|nr:glycosyltransferase family 9 protein [Bacteroidales bacterium]